MRGVRPILLASLTFLLASTGALRAETKVELKNVHLCCPACVKAVGEILKKIDGVKGECDAKAKTVSIAAKDDDTARKALEALAAAGFHGDTGSKDLAIKDDSGVTKGKVKSLTVTGVHNCCGSCTRALQATFKKVEGVTGDTAKAKDATFEVTGDFNDKEFMAALQKEGLAGKVAH